MTADPYIDRSYNNSDPWPDSGPPVENHPAGYFGQFGDDEDKTPTVPQKARRRMPPKKDLAVRGLTASLDRSVPLFVAIPAVVITFALAHWLPVGTLLKAGWIVGFALVAVAAGFQALQPNPFRRRALLALWVLVALGTVWMVAA